MKPRDFPSFRIFAGALCLLILITAPGCTASAKRARYLGRAENYFRTGDYAKAKIEYLNVLRVDPQNVTAIQRLGTIWLEQGAPLRAFPYLLGSRQLAPDALAVRTKLGLAYLSVGEVGEARKEAIAILQKDPKQGEAALLLADTTANRDELAASEQILQRLPDQHDAYVLQARASLAMRTNSLATAQGDLEQAQAADPKSPSVHLSLAMLAALRKDLSKADQELKTAVALAPARSVARIKYADFKIKSGATKEAQALLSETTHLVPDYLPAWQMQAYIANQEKDYQASLAMLENIFGADPDNLDARLLEAENLLAKGDQKKAITTLVHLDNAYKNVPLTKFRLARAYVQDNNRTQAIVVLTQAVSTAPNYTDAVLLLSELNITVGEAQTAVNALTDLLKKQPDLLDGRMLLANAYRALGRLDEAEATLNDLTKDAPQNPQIYLLLGMVQRQQNKPDEARSCFAKAQELAPDDLNILFQIVDLDIQQKAYDTAHQRVRDQLKKSPGSAPTQFLESRIYAAQQDWDHAEATLLKALELDPNFSSAYDLLISTYVSANKLTPALGQLDRLLAKNPDNPRALMMSALIYSNQKDVNKARESYEKLLASSPNFTAALNNLAYLYSENFNQADKAYELARRARSLLPNDASVADTLGWICYKRADYQQALQLSQEAAAKLPSEPEVQFHLAMASYMMGQTDVARAAFQRAAESPTDFPGKSEIPNRLAALGTGAAGAVLSTADLEAAVKRNPNDLITVLRLADAYEKQQAWDKARDTYQQAVGVNPRLLPAVDRLARLHAGPLHNPAKALEFARTARELAPNDAQVGALLGQLTYQSGNFIQAYSLLRDSARELPDDLGIRRDFALAAYHLGNVEEARRGMQGIVTASTDNKDARLKQEAQRFLMLTEPEQTPQQLAALEPEARQALQNDPGYVPALMVSATLQAQHGEAKLAVDTYAGVLQRAPDFVPAQTRLATLYLLDAGTREKAYDLAVKARKGAPNDPEAAEVLAAANFYRKEYPYAIQLLEESARRRPLNAASLYYLGMCYVQTNQSGKGQDLLAKALAAGLPEPLAAEAKRVIAAVAKHT